MARRYSRAEKEKWQALPELPAKRPPVRIPASDNVDLIAANKLTIIGRLTNPQIQKPTRAIIDFMAQVWNLEGRIEGRALRLDNFQVKFESEQELLQVLDKGPYHYKRWMLLLQRWEPTVSEHFSSTISFNVKIHGIPLHYWDEKTILTTGADLGKCTIRDEKEAKIWVEVNRLNPLIMKSDIELPTSDITEVEFEYIKIEKHCFTCFSLFHEESDCPYRPANMLPPKERPLGITQRIALQRIEAEKRRHDDRRGYRRSDDLRSSTRQSEDRYEHCMRNRVSDRRYYDRQENLAREPSILSRTARSNSAYHRNKAPSCEYRVVERNRPSSGSTVPNNDQANRYEGNDLRNSLPQIPERALSTNHNAEVTPKSTIKDRLGVPAMNKDGSNSGSMERRSALARLSGQGPASSKERSDRRAPSFESGRLQEVESRANENDPMDQEALEEIIPEETRVPASLRLGAAGSGVKSRRGTIPQASQSKIAGKRKITKPAMGKRIARSPLLGLVQRKVTSTRQNSTTRRKLAIERDDVVPCDKAGTSRQRKRSDQPTTVFIPGSTRGGVDFRPHQKSLP
ncbi:hypothetical protein Bca4012_011987 [Brassica carinata]